MNEHPCVFNRMYIKREWSCAIKLTNRIFVLYIFRQICIFRRKENILSRLQCNFWKIIYFVSIRLHRCRVTMLVPWFLLRITLLEIHLLRSKVCTIPNIDMYSAISRLFVSLNVHITVNYNMCRSTCLHRFQNGLLKGCSNIFNK